MKDGYMNDYEAGVLAGNDLWLNGTFQEAAALNLDDKHVAYAARQSVKNILYTYIDTNQTAIGIKVKPAPHSALLDGLCIGASVILALGIAACIAFTALPYLPFAKLAGGKSDNNGGGSLETPDGAVQN